MLNRGRQRSFEKGKYLAVRVTQPRVLKRQSIAAPIPDRDCIKRASVPTSKAMNNKIDGGGMGIALEFTTNTPFNFFNRNNI